MARYTGAVCRLCRREGQKLFLKGERCYTDKCSVGRRSYAPGQHGQGRKKLSEYGLQLRAKQATRRYYGILEGQFRHYYELAEKREGKTGEQLLSIIETRLDNVVYRLGFATSRPEARQLVVHNHFSVNGRKVNIPSYLIKAGDTVEIKEAKKSSPRYKEILEVTEGRMIPSWLEADHDNFTGTVKELPSRDEIDVPVNETLIVELYSK